MNPKELVYQFLIEQISTGKIASDSRVKEQYLVENLGISRTPIREALVELAAEGVLEREPRKGFRIKAYTKNDIKELVIYFGLLIGKCGELVCSKMEDRNFAKMHFLIDSMNSAIENDLYPTFNRLLIEFHDQYTEKCDNEFLAVELKRIGFLYLDRIHLFFKGSNQVKEAYAQLNTEHEQIVKLFEERKSQELRDYLEKTYWSVEKVEKYYKR